MGEKLNREVRELIRPRAAAGVVLLLLAAHAFVASATHFHASLAPSVGSSRSALLGRDEGERGTPPSGDPRCFLCRLQRDFISDLEQSAPALAPPASAAPEHESAHHAPARDARTLLRPGRAPPLA